MRHARHALDYIITTDSVLHHPQVLTCAFSPSSIDHTDEDLVARNWCVHHITRLRCSHAYIQDLVVSDACLDENFPSATCSDSLGDQLFYTDTTSPPLISETHDQQDVVRPIHFQLPIPDSNASTSSLMMIDPQTNHYDLILSQSDIAQPPTQEQPTSMLVDSPAMPIVSSPAASLESPAQDSQLASDPQLTALVISNSQPVINLASQSVPSRPVAVECGTTCNEPPQSLALDDSPSASEVLSSLEDEASKILPSVCSVREASLGPMAVDAEMSSVLSQNEMLVTSVDEIVQSAASTFHQELMFIPQLIDDTDSIPGSVIDESPASCAFEVAAEENGITCFADSNVNDLSAEYDSVTPQGLCDEIQPLTSSPIVFSSTNLPSSEDSTSSPSSSPGGDRIFTSSPPATVPSSDSSVLDDVEVLKHVTIGADTLPPSSSPMNPSSELDEDMDVSDVQVKPGEYTLEESSVNPAFVVDVGVESEVISDGLQVESALESANENIPIQDEQCTNEDTDGSKKRKREDETGHLPNPKRPTMAFHKQQHKKLAKPFRAPTMTVPEPMLLSKPDETPMPVSAQPVGSDLNKHRTKRAAAQFKSPLALGSSVPPSSARPTPTIQSLEHRAHVLKRAVKLKKEGEEDGLEGLVKKWTEAGRDVAWQVWDLVKDNSSGGESAEADNGKRRFSESWGWGDDDPESKRVKVEDSEGNCGWEVPQNGEDEHVEDNKPKETLGTMLLRLGIAHSTLGWVEDDEDFVNVC
ncbi:unnamed protein product [Mycena citricolor]|uniref:Uncharacterized protein n=1 Tax=Mycena citricolor TaxID=2018698 RepID=A0AAD2K2R5_9AGAR|nr:unnamed protein product [Mycena citricolor]